MYYNEYDFHMSEDFADILHYLGGVEPSIDEVWEVAREYEKIPSFENIWYSLVLAQIEAYTKENRTIEVDYYINARDTHFYINGDAIYSLDCYIKAIENKELE